MAKLAHGIADGPVTMAAKSHLRNGRPVVIAVSSNDALAGAAVLPEAGAFAGAVALPDAGAVLPGMGSIPGIPDLSAGRCWEARGAAPCFGGALGAGFAAFRALRSSSSS